MQFINSFRTRAGILLSLILVLLLWSAPAQSGSRHDFTGSFQVKKVADLGTEVRVILNVRLRNSSATDVADATLTLRGRPEPVKSFGSFPSVSVRAGQSVRLSGEFTIPRREFRRWRRELGPSMFLEFKDAAGNRVRRMIRVEEED